MFKQSFRRNSVRFFVLLCTLSCAALLLLRYHDRQSRDSVNIGLYGRSLTLHSAGGKLAVSVEDDRNFDTVATRSLFDRADEKRFNRWHDSFRFALAPQRDDVATWTIAVCYHPWFEPQKKVGPFGQVQPFIVSRPHGPANLFRTTGYGVIFPTAWLVTLLATPVALTVFAALRRRTGHKRGFPIKPAEVTTLSPSSEQRLS